jgi:Asp-tRNA(Asn)/Glu-tRNA(Gln) amidotransferase A subunit family amidase
MHDADLIPTTLDPTAPDAKESGLSRRGFVGRTGAAAAGAAVLAGTLTAAPAGAATKTAATGKIAAPKAARAQAAPGLPDPAAVKALNKPLVDHDIVELASLLQAREITSVALTQAYLDRIDKFNGPFEVYGDNGGYNTFVRIARDEALAQAAAADAELDAAKAGTGPAAPYLCGVPIGVKDSVGVAGRIAGNGSPAYKGNIAEEDATAISRLRDMGVVFLGHTIASAFSGAIAGNFAGNAWDKRYIPGGSSQGSGAAPINRLAAAAIGEETGGSIIWPSAINGASSIKPSLGLGSMTGVMPLSPTYDVLGPICRSGRDAALILNAIVGPEPLGDPQTLDAPNPFPVLPIAPTPGDKPLKGLTIGIPQTDWMYGTGANAGVAPQSTYDADHKAAFARVRGELEAMGATVKEFRGTDIADFGTKAGDYLDGDNPYYNNPKVLETIDGSEVTPRLAVVYANRCEINYIEAVAEFAATQPADVQTALTNQYGRRKGNVAANPITLAAQADLVGGVTNKARREGEVRRRQLIANYQKSLDDEGIDFMLVMSIGAEVGMRDPQNPGNGLPLRRNNQIANDLSWPMVNFPVGSTSKVGLPICVQFWGPRFSEPRLVQAMIDYQNAHPEHHTRFPADPVAAPKTATRAMRSLPEQEPLDGFLSADPVANELAAMEARG